MYKRQAYNYQDSTKDPGGFAHNSSYTLQILFDSIQAVDGDVTGMTLSLIHILMEAHGWEAVLAAVSIVIWHLYNVLVKHRNLSMFTGVLSHKIMEEEHAYELERLEAGGAPWKVIPPDVLARRRRVFLAVAGVVAVLAIALVFWMFTFEETVITTLPAATREVFVPLVTPTP